MTSAPDIPAQLNTVRISVGPLSDAQAKQMRLRASYGKAATSRSPETSLAGSLAAYGDLSFDEATRLMSVEFSVHGTFIDAAVAAPFTWALMAGVGLHVEQPAQAGHPSHAYEWYWRPELRTASPISRHLYEGCPIIDDEHRAAVNDELHGEELASALREHATTLLPPLDAHLDEDIIKRLRLVHEVSARGAFTGLVPAINLSSLDESAPAPAAPAGDTPAPPR